MSEYTPTTEEVRNALIRSAPLDEWELRGTQFDRWLADVKAQAWEEGYDTCFDLTTKPGDTYPYVNPYRKGENNV